MIKILEKILWGAYSRCYDSLLDLKPYQELIREVADKLRLISGIKILDAGCGTGNLELEIIRRNIDDLHIEAIDFSRQMLKRSKNKCRGINYINFFEHNLNERLPYPNNYFDRVASINVAYVVETFKELERVLKPDGKIVIVTPKKDYNVSLILKAHRHSYEFDEKWSARDFFGQIKLLLRSVGFNGTMFKFLFVAIINQIISKKSEKGVYKTYNPDELILELKKNGSLIIENSGLTYGKQCIIITADKVLIKPVETVEELNGFFELRFKTYCLETKIFNPDDFPERKETDIYDEHSFSIVALRKNKVIAGVRLIKAINGRFRSQNNLPAEIILPKIDPVKTLEISRLVLKDLDILLPLILRSIEVAKEKGYRFFCGTIRLGILKFFKEKNGWQFDFVSKPYKYHDKWDIVFFILDLNKI